MKHKYFNKPANVSSKYFVHFSETDLLIQQQKSFKQTRLKMHGNERKMLKSFSIFIENAFLFAKLRQFKLLMKVCERV
jgi:hypothetical protein